MANSDTTLKPWMICLWQKNVPQRSLIGAHHSCLLHVWHLWKSAYTACETKINETNANTEDWEGAGMSVLDGSTVVYTSLWV